MVSCQVCNDAESKYKCPKCRLQYCSLVCFKKHKESSCSTNQQEDQNASQFRKDIKTVGDPDDEEPSRLAPEDLRKLLQSDAIHEFLEYSQIREFVKKVDSSPAPEKLLDALRSEDSVFDDFTQKLVEITFKEKLERLQKEGK
ncbi:hypothetical protein G6F46_011933 [Rhizopus delemar]|uniref:HIT-type domain-containing protein n=3 Tax=Rhizopus TaxID=4842 RepID=I1BKC4_RHIO9|nr:hypothetical protein RO3G_01358 [Rhizopus delemar RA 99-880]KAG1048095.1 hypothetical protein G6F43_009491 [Rhizopus delemar]KAG1539805.1 hypothetical protein G6F51_008913 [Rhizopus arrhizus]KAG1454289.1 hypothetical protein G6F55_007694 [Rhizopus delemar]KAG1493848.1 hypothetical protein G6F54_008292 [Rhizopus delemar]|eukprot:EIE76654.1 hypothetical protein RO3G_01358 [Rhizopus delemar RA 99-880]